MFFLILFQYAYQQIQNGLKRRGKILNNLKSSQIHIFRFQTILHLFLLQKKSYLVAERGMTPPPRLSNYQISLPLANADLGVCFSTSRAQENNEYKCSETEIIFQLHFIFCNVKKMGMSSFFSYFLFKIILVLFYLLTFCL